MATIKTAIQIQDGMSSVFKSMNTVMNLVLNTFESIQSTASKPIDVSSIQAAREELSRAQVVANEFQNQLLELSSSPVNIGMNNNNPNINNPQSMYDEAIENNRIQDSIVNSITTQQQYNQLLKESTNKLQQMEQIATDISNITGEDKSLLMANNSEYQRMANIKSILLQKEQEIQNTIANQKPQWENLNMPIFTNTGLDRYEQEIASANNMINKLSQSQMKMQVQAQMMDLLPKDAIKDIDVLNTRIDRIRTTLQKVENKKLTGMEADKASNQVETLRQQLFEAVKTQEELTRAMKTMDIKATNMAYNKLVSNLDTAEKNIRDNISNQNQFNNSINTGVNSADGLLGKFKQIALTVASMAGMQKVLGLSDQVASNSARLDLIVDDGGSVEELEDKIFASAIRSRGYYLDTANVISKLGILAGDSFKNNDEMVAFAELMNKNFIIGGASIQEQTTAMYQLTQAMAAGKLQGDEFRSIMENAPLLAEAIAEYTGKTKGELKEMSSEGVITAEIIKNAMFASADEINTRFEKMPMTWAQIWTKMKNIALKAFEPVLKKLNELANNPQIQGAFQSLINVLSIAAQAFLGLVEGAMWLYNVLEPIAPVILGIVGAYVAFNIISGIVSAVLGIMSTIQTIQAAASMLQAGATLSATAAQYGLNTALYACPIVWVVALILGLIVALTYLWFTNDEVAYALLYLWDALQLGIMAAGLGIQAVWYGLQLAALFLWLGIQTVVLGLMTAWYGFQTGVEAVCLGVLSIFQGLYNGIVSIVNGIITVLNKIPGVEIDTVEAATFADDFAGKMANNIIDRNAKLQEMASQMDGTMDQINEIKGKMGSELSASATNIQNKAIELNATRDDRVAHRNDWISGATSAVKDAMNMDSYDFGSMGSDLGNIGNNLGKISGDTGSIKDSLDVTEEDLKYMRDLAERDVINRFTTAEIKIDMTNNNNINSEQDLDGIINTLSEGLYETMTIAAEGVHE